VVPKMGFCGGPICGATFCEQVGLLLTSAARTKRKKCDPKKLKLLKPGTLAGLIYFEIAPRGKQMVSKEAQ